jgi:hypothetical protein
VAAHQVPGHHCKEREIFLLIFYSFFYNFFKIYSLIFFQNYINAAISNAGSIATAVSAVDPYRHLKQR